MQCFRLHLVLFILLAFTFLFFGCNSSDSLSGTKTVSLLQADVERESPATSDSDLDEYISDQTSFALWMHHAAINENGDDQNIIFSPLSIATAFAMLWPGAAGETADEIAEMLHFGMEPDRFHPAANRLERALASRNEYTPREGEGDAPILETVNDLWGLDEYPYKDSYLELLARHYGAGMWIANFAGAPEAARFKINEHIADHTRELIPEILPEGSINRLTRLVLTNAIYFKGAWRYPFEVKNTVDRPFISIDGITSDVPMMSGEIDNAAYADMDGTKVVELPYVGNDLSMVLILPDRHTFSAYENALEATELSSIFEALTPMPGYIQMPRFAFESEMNLSDIFQDAGFILPFTEGAADFSGLSPIAIEEELHISSAFHKAVIGVDEEGTEAAAATAISVGATSAPVDRFNVQINRPFLFVIRDRPTDTILFMGRVVDAAAVN